jgi:hypothetical protein
MKHNSLQNEKLKGQEHINLNLQYQETLYQQL